MSKYLVQHTLVLITAEVISTTRNIIKNIVYDKRAIAKLEIQCIHMHE